MSAIVIATAVVGIVGLVIGLALVAAGKKFYVPVDERVTAVREALPGNNCGACGFAGCDAMASAIVSGEAAVNACPVCSASAVETLSKIMGVEATASVPKKAFVRCSGDCEKSPATFEYVGISDCRAAALAGIPARSCSHGCLGLGSCATACPQNAIVVDNGVAKVRPELCVGCGLCAAACPKNLIDMVPATALYAVACSSKAKGAAVKKVCSAGCIGCMLCVKQCESGAISVKNNVASIDYDKCTFCGKCAEKCPAKVINLRVKV